MARIRTIKPEFFRHEALFEAEQATGLPLRVAYAGLFTAADREGRFKWSPRSLKLDCLPYDEVDFAAVLEALAVAGFIVRYEIGGETYGAIPSWKAHQHINLKERESDIPAPGGESMCGHRTGPVNARGEGKGKEGKGTEENGAQENDTQASLTANVTEAHAIDEATDRATDPQTQRGKDQRAPAGASAMRQHVDAEFDAFWKLYPKRKGPNPKAPAEKAFHAAVRSGVHPNALICAVKNFATAEASKAGTEFIPMTLTWLRQRRFEEYGPDPGLLERLRGQAPMMRERGYELDEDAMAWRKMGADR